MRPVCLANAIILSVSIPLALLGQTPATFSIVGYHFVGEAYATRTQSSVTYSADLMNSGPALEAVIATLTSGTSSTKVVTGQNTLRFAPVPAAGQVSSNNTFTVLVDRTTTFSFGSLQWTFQAVSAPVANAGPDQPAAVGATVVLNGSGSSGANGNPFTYLWTLNSRPAGSSAALAGNNSVSPTFVADKAGTYTAQLIVNDGVANSLPSTVTITASCGKPVANAGPAQTVSLNSLVQLSGSGSTVACGSTLTYKWSFTGVPANSKATLSNPNIVNPTFTADLPGAFTAQLIVNDGTSTSDPASVTISANPPQPPTANAGSNQSVSVGSPVQLSGSGSDPQNLSVTYLWSLTAKPPGSAAGLSSTTISNPTLAPDKAGTYSAQLTVNNGFLSSPASSVTITASCPKPVANTGPAQTVNINSLVQLNGSGSTDACGLVLTYKWSLTDAPAHSAAALNNLNIPNPAFTPDLPGPYTAQLIVNDGNFNSDPAAVTITANPPLAPTANPGANQTVDVGGSVQLTATGSDPQNLPLTYQWSLSAKPPGSTAVLSSTTIPNPTFVADRAGGYSAQLIVNNGLLSSPPSTVTITACAKPTANAGTAQTVNVNSVVHLDGSASTDACGLTLTYKWSFTSVPPNSTATLHNSNTVNPTFTPDLPGPYTAQLIVNNSRLSSDPAALTITTSAPQAPTANGGPTQTISAGSTVQLSGSGSDPQNLPLTYQWSLTTKPSGSTAVLSSTTISNPTFIADKAGTYNVDLTVNNGFLNSSPSSVKITASACAKPVANAGAPQTVNVNALVQLDGGGSTDTCQLPLTYKWSFTGVPPNSTAALSNPNIVNPTFTPNLPGTYKAQLIVNNGTLDSDPASVTVTTASPGSVTYTYDSQGRLATATYTSATGPVTVTYTYDPAGNRSRVVTQ